MLPFGIAHAPWLFTKIKHQLVRFWRLKGIRCVSFVDDVLFACSSLSEALKLRDQVLRDMIECGWSVSWAKSQIVPSQCVKFLGFEIDTVSGVTTVPEKKVNKIFACIDSLLEGRSRRVRVRLVA